MIAGVETSQTKTSEERPGKAGAELIIGVRRAGPTAPEEGHVRVAMLTSGGLCRAYAPAASPRGLPSDAAERARQHTARVGHLRRAEPGDPASERLAPEGVEVVKARHTRFGHAVGRTKGKLALKPANCPGAGGNDHRTDSISDGVSRQHENGSISSRRARPPDLAPYHAGVALHPCSSAARRSSASVSGSSA